MRNIRPGDATHSDNAGRYYKINMFNGDWMLYKDCSWGYVGPMPDGILQLLPPPAVVAPSPFEAPSTHPAGPCLPSPRVIDQAEAYTKLATELDDGAPFTNYFMKYRFVGSRITCNPPPLDTDQDVLVLAHESNLKVMQRKILEAGFVMEGSLPADGDIDADKDNVFHSYRKGDMNYIVTTDEVFYKRFSTATELARKYNLMEKSDRIQLFQAVLYGKWWA